jgi:hypothetical protein
LWHNLRMITLDEIRNFLLNLPDVSEGTSWDAISFKVNKKVIVFWNPKYDCPVFKMPFEERDFLLEIDSETFFTTGHHKNFPCILGRPQLLDKEWVQNKLYQIWRAQVSKKTLREYDLKQKNTA